MTEAKVELCVSCGTLSDDGKCDCTRMGYTTRKVDDAGMKAHVGHSPANGCWFIRVHPFATEKEAKSAIALILSVLPPPPTSEGG